jgi:hypothetical protein
MGIERAKIEAVYSEIRRLTDICDWIAWADLLAEDATFVNSMLDEPIRGKEAIRAFMSTVPTTIVNHTEWVTIDGNRLAMGWNERQRPDAPVYRGFSTLVFDEDGRIESYEGMFDTAAVAAATAA